MLTMVIVYKPSVQVIVIFLAVITTSQKIQASCIHKENVTRMWRKIETPAFPSPFPATTKCTWSLTSPPTYRIKIQFTQFSLMPSNENGICKYQWLSVINGLSISGNAENGYKVCGKHSLGTLVTTGRFLQLYLHSTVAASGQKYIGFQASLTTTQEKPQLPGLNVEELLRNESKKRKKPIRTRETLGSVLNRFRPQSGPVLTQSQRIEEMNKRRNLGKPVRENPVYDANGNVIGGFPSTKRIKTTTARPNIIQNVPSTRRPPTLSNEIKTVIIVIGIISFCFVLLLLIKKCGFLQKISKWRKNDQDEESSVDSLSITKENDFVKSNEYKEKEAQQQKPCSQISNSKHNFKSDKIFDTTQLEKSRHGAYTRSQPPNKTSAAQRIKRTISKKAGVKRTYQHQAQYREQIKRKHERKIAEDNLWRKCPQKINESIKNDSNRPTEVAGIKTTTGNPRSRHPKSLQRQSQKKVVNNHSNSVKNRSKTTNKRSYRNQAYNKNDFKSAFSDSQSVPTQTSKKSKPNPSRAKYNRQSNTKRKKVYKYSSSVASDSSSTSSYDSTSSESSVEKRSKPKKR